MLSATILTKPVGIIYHLDMLKHCCTWDKNHIEVPERLGRCYDKCKEKGLIDRCIALKPCTASNEELMLYHTPEIIQKVESSQNLSEDGSIDICQHFDDVYLCPASFQAALLAAGCTIEAARAVVENRCGHSMALVRPPGHHAMASEPNGFCVFNNVTIAAKKMLKDYEVSKIAIIDWDVHHGQGTQRAFYDSNQVLYISIHRFEFGSFWPNIRESDLDHLGTGPGTGFNVNVPLNETGCGDVEYLSIFFRIILPLLNNFQPDLIFVSAGYDAALGCPEGQMQVTPACYAHLTRLLMNIAPVVCVLEGGYHLKSLEESLALTLSSLLGDACPSLPPMDFTTVKPAVEDVISDLIHILAPYWPYFEHLIAQQNLHFVQNVNDERRFIGTPRPSIYELRNKYPEADKAEIQHYDAIVDQLLKTYQFEEKKLKNDVLLIANNSTNEENFDFLKLFTRSLFTTMKFEQQINSTQVDYENCNARITIVMGNLENLVSLMLENRVLKIEINECINHLIFTKLFNPTIDQIETNAASSSESDIFEIKFHNVSKNGVYHHYNDILPFVYSFSPDLIIIKNRFQRAEKWTETYSLEFFRTLAFYGSCRVIIGLDDTI